MLQNTSKTLGTKKSMVYKNTPGGGGKPYLAYEYQNKKKTHLTPFLVPLSVLKLVFFTVSGDCLYQRDIIKKILNE